MQKLTVFHLISKHLFKNSYSLCFFYELLTSWRSVLEVTIATEF